MSLTHLQSHAAGSWLSGWVGCCSDHQGHLQRAAREQGSSEPAKKHVYACVCVCVGGGGGHSICRPASVDGRQISNMGPPKLLAPAWTCLTWRLQDQGAQGEQEEREQLGRFMASQRATV